MFINDIQGSSSSISVGPQQVPLVLVLRTTALRQGSAGSYFLRDRSSTFRLVRSAIGPPDWHSILRTHRGLPEQIFPTRCSPLSTRPSFQRKSSSPRSLNAPVKSWRNGRGLEDELEAALGTKSMKTPMKTMTRHE